MRIVKVLLALPVLLLGVGYVITVKAQELPFTINADTFSYSENGEEFIADGQVYVFSDDMSLKADKLIFNQQRDKIYATGNVIMLDSSLNTTYSEKVELTGDFKRGVAKRIIMMFNDSTGLMQSSKAVKVSEKKLNLFDVNYTSCPLRKKDETLPWHITAKKVSYNSEEEYVIYRNAVFNLLDIPVMYMPVFYHSTNSEKAVSGFLNPGLASSNADGFGFKTGYFWAVDDNQDATFRVRYLGKRGLILGAEHRYVGSNFSSDVRIEGLEDEQDDKHARGMMTAEAEYIFEEGRRAGINTTLTSDEDYLDEMKQISDAYRSSTIYGEDTSQNHYIGVSSRYFIDMRDDVDDETLAQPVARVQMEKLLDIDERGGQFKLNSDVLSLIRQSGQDTNRAVAKAEYIKPYYSTDGSLFEFSASVRGDYYSYNENSAGSSTQTESRLLPEAAVSWEKPFISPGFKHIVTPKLMLITSPEEDFDDIPNEDSTSFELDATNLFEKNRFSGFDRVETGNRVVYGIDTKYGSADKLNFQAFLGQSYNFADKEENIAEGVTSNNKNSDWVGFLDIEPNRYLSAGTDFRLDGSDFSGQRIDSNIKLKKESKYFSLDNNLSDDYIRLVHSYLRDDSEEVNFYALYNLSEDFALKGRVQRNMTENITLTQELDLLYKSCCYNLSFKVRKKQSDDDDTEDSLDFLVNFAILPTGRER
ncbi:MAG TPA: hypothetical protein DCL21_07480 [Alphaproteobacteria bacterium]|nr:hypothetical protein [Alphaproteobacteria bacterium]